MVDLPESEIKKLINLYKYLHILTVKITSFIKCLIFTLKNYLDIYYALIKL